MPTLSATRLAQSNEQCSIKIFVGAPPTRRHYPVLNPLDVGSGTFCRSLLCMAELADTYYRSPAKINQSINIVLRE